MPNEAFAVLCVSSISMIRPGHDERAVAHPVDLGDARADRGAEHHEIERGRDHRRHDALQQRAPGAGHFEAVDRADGAESSSLLPDQTDENVLQRALRRLEVLEADAGAVEIAQQRGDAGALALGVVGVDRAPCRRRASVRCARRASSGIASSRCCRCSVSCFLPSLRISSAFSSTRMSSPLVDDADPVGHLLGFLDVVRRQDDGDAGCAQRAHDLPHVAGAARRRRRRSARRGTGSAARATAPWRSSRGASCRRTAS